MSGKKTNRMQATVSKVFKAFNPLEPEKAQINIEDAEDLYREIRVENVFNSDDGGKRSLKAGAKVDVIIEADSNATIKNPA